MRDVYIVECVRTPLGRGKKGGILSSFRPVDLFAECLSEVVKRANLDKSLVEDVVAGCVTPLNDQGGNIGRLGALKAGFPTKVPGVQINRMCGSGQQAIHFISQAISSGDIEIGIGGGIEMMSNQKMGSDIPPKSFIKLLKNFPYPLIPQHNSAEKMAKKYNINRDECEQFAFDSHHKAGLTRDQGFFDDQIVKLKNKKNSNNELITEDEGIRYPPNMKALKKLKSLFAKNGVVTAGTASQITDGASAVLLASSNAVKKYNLRVRARILSRCCVGSDPIIMLDGVIPATKMAIKKAGLTINDIDLFEVNEAFAVVPLALKKTLNIDNNKLNISGGAIAHGHPLGATGGVLMTKLVYDLERTNNKYGLQTMCIGWGMATATVIQKTNKLLPERYIKSKL